jgi:hypothetical protein
MLARPENIELSIEDQAFLRWYDLVPLAPPFTPSPVGDLSLFLSLPVCRRSNLRTGGGGGGGWARNREEA